MLDHRSRLINELIRLPDVDVEAPPTVPLDWFFQGNAEEQSIAPNLWGYGRPSLKTMYQQLKAIENRPEVNCVLVGMHTCWDEALDQPTWWPGGENIHIITSASQSEVEQWSAGLQVDAVLLGWPYGEHPMSPKPPANCVVYSLSWD
ncbi:hypothetical protein [Marinicella meishanensis]|uniref:hypothetical protein n=1 Tax=Marinicella meishanensis TaxID=2873263 RepID=UPI001CBE334F|nr:hypothetical protein [Marinicella sp. NBU2979]